MNVAFFVFNRPDLTSRVFETIRLARPERLLIVADGPRPDRPEDVERCAQVRKAVQMIDWPCEILKNYSDCNLGCRKRIATGLDWVFSLVEDAIILEDDCLPSPEFFTFAQQMLVKFSDQPAVMHISGSRLVPSSYQTAYSYFFSAQLSIWGWATWRRAWTKYDGNLTRWPEFKLNDWMRALCLTKAQAEGLTAALDAVYHGHLDTWDWQWFFTCWCHGGLSVVPAENLVSNLGFASADATHTTLPGKHANLARGSLGNLRHPPFMIRDLKAEWAEYREVKWRWRFTSAKHKLLLCVKKVWGHAKRVLIIENRG